MQHYVEESNDALLAKLPVRFRINCVLYKKYPREQLIPFMERFRRVRMRCGFHFRYKDLELVYHKTLPYSTIVEKRSEDGKVYAILYDILIKQNGRIDSDWDGTVMDLDAYARCKFEPYDLKWLERVSPKQIEEERKSCCRLNPAPPCNWKSCGNIFHSFFVFF